MVFRSVQLQVPQKMLGWDYGTLDINPVVKAIDLPKDLENMRMKIRTNLARGKLHSGDKDGELNQHDGHVIWKAKHGSIRLPVRKRYASPLIVEFRKDSAMRDRTPAFCVLWLRDIPDNEEQTIRLPVWKGDLDRAEHNVLSECGEKVGEIEVTMTLWSGLSGYHSGLAKKDTNLGDVMEVLDTCNDNDDMDWDDGNENPDDTSSSSSSSDDDFDNNDDDTASTRSSLKSSLKELKPSFLSSKSSNLNEDGKRGPVESMKDYKKHAKQLHRKNKGMMQWKGPRTLAYMKHLAERGEKKVEGVFKHGERGGQGVETEV